MFSEVRGPPFTCMDRGLDRELPLAARGVAHKYGIDSFPAVVSDVLFIWHFKRNFDVFERRIVDRLDKTISSLSSHR